tara:strand:- start:991 stop:1782 length:792 start_codon:yes stop_codon:yes gene_type:complete
MKLALHGKVVLITGASRGIGKAIAVALCRKGARVIITARGMDKLKEFQKQLEKDGLSADAYILDVCSEKSIVSLMKHIKNSYGKLDIVVNNAGIGLFETVRDSKITDAKKVFDTNVWGPLLVIQQALPLMPTGGAVVNISSAISFYGTFYQGVYSGSKSALDRLSEALAIEERGISVTSVFVDRTKTTFKDHVVGPKDKLMLPFTGMQETSVQDAAAYIVRALEQRKQYCYPNLKIRLFRAGTGVWPEKIGRIFGKQFLKMKK